MIWDQESNQLPPAGDTTSAERVAVDDGNALFDDAGLFDEPELSEDSGAADDGDRLVGALAAPPDEPAADAGLRNGWVLGLCCLGLVLVGAIFYIALASSVADTWSPLLRGLFGSD